MRYVQDAVQDTVQLYLAKRRCTCIRLYVARPPYRDPPPGDRLPGGDDSLRSDGPEIRPGVGARPGN
eukprot:1804407-Pyramimonas_sp.AAC.1